MVAAAVLWVLHGSEGRSAEVSTPAEVPHLPLVNVWMERRPGHTEEWKAAPPRPVRAGEVPSEALFRGVSARHWPAGLVPVFLIESESRFELRRLPLKGRENFTDPLFFALPPADEPEASRICGRWSLVSASREGRRDRLAMEVAVLGEKVAARLDQDTDFRFAFLTGALWQSNRLSLTVEYINDRYALTGEEAGGILRGTWRQIPEGDDGVWEARRPNQTGRTPPTQDVVPLYEWRRSTDNGRRYLVEGESPGEGWRREDRELCRVWKATPPGRRDPLPKPAATPADPK